MNCLILFHQIFLLRLGIYLCGRTQRVQLEIIFFDGKIKISPQPTTQFMENKFISTWFALHLLRSILFILFMIWDCTHTSDLQFIYSFLASCSSDSVFIVHFELSDRSPSPSCRTKKIVAFCSTSYQ